MTQRKFNSSNAVDQQKIYCIKNPQQVSVAGVIN